MTPHDGDEDSDGNVCVSDGSLSFYSKYDNDDDGRHHQKKCHSHNDLAVTVNDSQI